MDKPVVTIALGSYNRRTLLEYTIDSIRNNGIDAPYEILVIDGGSTDGSFEYLARQKDIVTVVQHNRGEWNGQPIPRRSWGYFMNYIFRAAKGEFVCMISDDCLLHPGCVRNGVEEMRGLIASGRKIGAMPFYWRDWPRIETYFVCTAFGVPYVNHGLYWKRALDEIGYLDEDAYFFYNADQDVCLRMKRAGYEIVPCETALVEHYAHANVKLRQSNATRMDDDIRILMERWQDQYPDFTKETFHGKLLKQFDDPHDTVKLFREYHRRNVSHMASRVTNPLKKIGMRLRRKLKGLISGNKS